MPNLVATGGLTVYNITQLGAESTTGSSSNFLITPQEGYYIAATQFSVSDNVDLATDYPEITSVTFTDTTSAFTPSNEVMVNVNWNGVTAISSDYDFDLQIQFNDVENVYSIFATNVELNMVKGNGPWNNANWQNNVITQFSIPPNLDGVAAATDVVIYDPLAINTTISFTSLSSGPVVVCDISFTASLTEGDRFFAQDPSILAAFPIDELSLGPEHGTVSFELLSTNLDYFGNVYKAVYRIFYTRVENQEDDVIDVIGYGTYNSQGYIVSNGASNQVIANGYGAGDVLDGAGTASSELTKQLTIFNIPLENIQITFSDNWVQNGDSAVNEIGNNNFIFSFDVDAIGAGVASRTLTATVKDTLYNISRRTFFIKQNEVPTIDLKIGITSDDEIEMLLDTQEETGYGFIADETLFADNGKIVSNPESGLYAYNYYELIPSEGNPQNTNVYQNSGGVGQIVQNINYSLYAFTDSQVTEAEMNNTDLQIEQVNYPLDSVLPLPWLQIQEQILGNGLLGVWKEKDSGVFQALFKVRPQDKTNYLGTAITDSVDRTATITVTHPTDASISDTTTVEQDAYYRSDVDTVTLTASTATSTQFNDLVLGQNATDTAPLSSQIGDIVTYRVYITMADWENDFNMVTAITTDDTVTDAFKQYPRPRLRVRNSGTYTSINGAQVVETSNLAPNWTPDIAGLLYIPPESLVYNENYNASDANNNYQYYVDINAYKSDSLSDRTLIVRCYHSQNDSNNYNAYDDEVTITQSPSQVANFTPAIGDPNALQYDVDHTEQAIIVFLSFNGSSVPTVGVFTDSDQYLPLAPVGDPGATGYPTVTTLEHGFAGVSYTLGALLGNSQSIQFNFPANTPLSSRSINFVAYHEDNSPLDSNGEQTFAEPNDGLNFTQIAAPFDELTHNVIVQDLPGTNEFSGGDGGSATFYFYVSDFTQDDFNGGDNKPIVEVTRYTNQLADDTEPTQYINPSTGLYDTEGVIQDNPAILSQDVIANPAWETVDATLGFFYTHSVTINYNANTTGSVYFFAVRARHQYDPNWQLDDYEMITLLAPETLTIPNVFAELSNGTITDNLIETAFTPDTATIPSTTDSITVVFRYNDWEENQSTIEDGAINPDFNWLYPSATLYTQARYLSPDLTNVFQNPADDIYDTIPVNIPATFHVDSNLGNTTHVINNYNFSIVQGFPNNFAHLTNQIVPNINGLEEPGFNFGQEITVVPHSEPADLEYFIGAWKGDRAPRTNLITTQPPYGDAAGTILENQGNKNFIHPAPVGGSNYNAYSMNDVLTNISNPSAVNLNQAIITNGTYFPVQGDDGQFNGFDWNYHDVDATHQTWQDKRSRVEVQFLIHKPTRTSSDQTSYSHSNFHFQHTDSNGFTEKYGKNKVLGISFEVEDYEALPGTYNNMLLGRGPLEPLHAYTSQISHQGAHATSSIASSNPVAGGGVAWEYGVPDFHIGDEEDFELIGLDDQATNQLSITGNGKYESRVKMKDDKHGQYIKFVLCAFQRFKVRNFTVWEINDDIAIRPGTTTDFTVQPDATIKIVHETTTALPAFDSLFNASPISAFDAEQINSLTGELNITNATSLGCTVGPVIQWLSLQITNANVDGWVIKAWDGSNASTLTDNVMIDSANIDQAYGSTIAYITLGIADFYADVASSRSVTIGVFQQNFSDTTIAPTDTFTITQNSVVQEEIM